MHEETAARVGTGGPVVTAVRVEIVEHVGENSLIAAGAVAATAAHSHLSKASAASSIRLLCSRIQYGLGCRHQGFRYEQLVFQMTFWIELIRQHPEQDCALTLTLNPKH